MVYRGCLIVVEDIEKSRFLYEQVLGQTVIADFGENISYTGGFSIHLKSHFRNLINQEKIISRSNNSELYFEHDDLEPVLNQLKELDMEFIHEIREQPWKQQVFRFYDYDKNLIEIGERMEHVAYRLSLQEFSIEEIARITYLTKEEVNESIIEYSEI